MNSGERTMAKKSTTKKPTTIQYNLNLKTDNATRKLKAILSLLRQINSQAELARRNLSRIRQKI